MKRVAAVLLGLTLTGAAPQPVIALHYFAGVWKCGGVTWTFTALSTGSPWMRATYRSVALSDGTAVMGYVAGMNAYVFRDFHTDGSYADLSSPGPSAGRWQWTGPYYPVEGGEALQGRTTYTELSSTKFQRRFELLRDQGFDPVGNDVCVKTNP